MPTEAAPLPSSCRHSAALFLLGLAAGLLLVAALRPDAAGEAFYRRALARSSQTTADALRLAEERRQDGRQKT